MASKMFEVDSYRVVFRPDGKGTWQFPGPVNVNPCHGYVRVDSKTSADRLYMPIAPDGSATLPDSGTDDRGDYWLGTSVIILGSLDVILDLLRNEKPIFMRLSNSSPSLNSISTSDEPVGEGVVDISP